jgi:hypothetical protein
MHFPKKFLFFFVRNTRKKMKRIKKHTHTHTHNIIHISIPTMATPRDTVYEVLLAANNSTIFSKVPALLLRYLLKEFLASSKRFAMQVTRAFRLVDKHMNPTPFVGQRAMLLMGPTVGEPNQGMTATLAFDAPYQELVLRTPEGVWPRRNVPVGRALLVGHLPEDVVQALKMAVQQVTWFSDTPFGYKGFDPNLLPYQALVAGMCWQHVMFRAHVAKADPKWLVEYEIDLFIGMGVLMSWYGMGFTQEILASDPTLLKVLSVVAALEDVPLLSKFNAMVDLPNRSEAFRARALAAIVESVGVVPLPETLFDDEPLQLAVYRELLRGDATGRRADRIDHLTRFAHDLGDRSRAFRDFVLHDVTTSMFRWQKAPSQAKAVTLVSTPFR